MFRKLLSAALAVLMLVSAASCTKTNEENPDGKNSESTSASGENVEKASVLTGVYRSETLSIPEGYSISESISPLCDKDSGEIKLLLKKYEEMVDENGEYTGYQYLYLLNTYDKDLNEISSEPIELPPNGDAQYYIDTAALTNDALLFIHGDWSDSGTSYYLCKYSFSDKTVTKSDELSSLFDQSASRRWFYIDKICASSDGNIYLSSNEEILVMNSDFIKQFSVPISNWVNSMAASPDGKVYISSYFDEGQGIAPIDTEKKALGDVIYIDDRAQCIAFGDGYDVYVTSDSGVSGVSLSEGGNTSELLMNFQSSDIDESNFELISVVDKDTFLANDRSEDTDRTKIFRKSDDIDLSAVKVIEVAVSNYVSQSLRVNTIKYNKTHKDSRIVINDYSQYNTEEDYRAGVKKLARDIVNGLYKPDIVVGSSYANEAAQQIIDNDLFVDLNTIIDADSEIDKNDIFDCVKRTFSTSDGKMWGITDQFTIDTLVGKTETLGGKTSWTIDEMLDYALSLPDGCSIIEGPAKSNVTENNFVKSLFTSFIDMENNTCDFENETFCKLLNYINTLPDEYNYEYNNDNYYEKYHNGTIALYDAYLYDPHSWLSLELIFNSKDYTLIGYPIINEGDRGGKLGYSDSYIITSYCGNTDIAWDFIKTIINPEYDTDFGMFMYIHNCPIFKSSFDLTCNEYYKYEFELYYNGSASWGTKDSENPRELDGPGIIAYFTEEDAAAMKKYLNDSCGIAATESIPDEITSIITEEISSFTSGVKSAEDCARVIQSRVKLWLAEHE
ncbi:MAG: extracellular solute-binding protein [Eubacteriales bacterium]